MVEHGMIQGKFQHFFVMLHLSCLGEILEMLSGDARLVHRSWPSWWCERAIQDQKSDDAIEDSVKELNLTKTKEFKLLMAAIAFFYNVEMYRESQGQ